MKKKRKDAGMSIRELSDASGVPDRTIRHWEAGHAAGASYANLSKVAKALGCTIDDIVEGEEKR